MWCDIDKSKMPIIKVNFKDESQVESDFDKLLDEWISFYDRKIPFYFVFDTRNLNNLNIKYAYKMSSFIKKLKKLEKQYLLSSIVIVKNQYIRFLLNIVFSITKPVANVYLFSNHADLMITEDIQNIYNEKSFNQVIDDYKSNFTCIKSKCLSVAEEKEQTKLITNQA